jgi:hypothetical protein
MILTILQLFRPVRFTLYLRVARPKRSVGVGRSTTSDSHALRTSGRATQRRSLLSIVQIELFHPTISKLRTERISQTWLSFYFGPAALQSQVPC